MADETIPPPAPPAAETPPPAQTPPATETPPDTTAPPVTPPKEGLDDFRKTMLWGLGLAVGEEPPPAADISKPRSRNETASTFGERIRSREEQAALAKPPEGTAPPASPDPTKPPEGAAPPQETPEIKIVPKTTDRDLERAVEAVLERREPRAPAPAPPPAATPPPPAAPDPFEASLPESAKEELELARFAAKTMPERYKDEPDKLLAFYKRHDAFILQGAKDDPERTFDDNDEGYIKFLRTNKPRMAERDRRVLEEARLTERIEARLQETHRKELDDIRRRQQQLEARPKVEHAVREYENGMTELLKNEKSAASAIMKRVGEVGWKQTVDEDPIIARHVATIHQKSIELATEYAALVTGAAKYDEKNPHPNHTWLFNFIASDAARFQRHGGAALKDAQGRTFLPRAEYFNIAQNDPAKAKREHFTWNDRDILVRLALNTEEQIADVIKEEESKLEKAGYRRVKAGETPPKPAEDRNGHPKTETSKPKTEPPPASVKVGATPSPGMAKVPDGNRSNLMSDKEIAILLGKG